MRLVNNFVLFLLLFFAYSASFGCTCINLGPLTKKEFRRYDTVVKVKIQDVITSERGKEVVAEVIEIYKGVVKDSIFVVITERDPGLCGIDPKINETWLIYSFNRKDFSYTDICTQSKRLDFNEARNRREEKLLKRELRFLEEHQKKN